MWVRVISTPPGEAPEAIRRAWVGLRLPLMAGSSGVAEVSTVGVVSGKPSVVARILGLGLRSKRPSRGYLIDPVAAIKILEASAPAAAAWWKTNAPHVPDGRIGSLFFHDHCCSLETGSARPEDTSGEGPFTSDVSDR